MSLIRLWQFKILLEYKLPIPDSNYKRTKLGSGNGRRNVEDPVIEHLHSCVPCNNLWFLFGTRRFAIPVVVNRRWFHRNHKLRLRSVKQVHVFSLGLYNLYSKGIIRELEVLLVTFIGHHLLPVGESVRIRRPATNNILMNKRYRVNTSIDIRIRKGTTRTPTKTVKKREKKWLNSFARRENVWLSWNLNFKSDRPKPNI